MATIGIREAILNELKKRNITAETVKKRAFEMAKKATVKPITFTARTAAEIVGKAIRRKLEIRNKRINL